MQHCMWQSLTAPSPPLLLLPTSSWRWQEHWRITTAATARLFPLAVAGEKTASKQSTTTGRAAAAEWWCGRNILFALVCSTPLWIFTFIWFDSLWQSEISSSDENGCQKQESFTERYSVTSCFLAVSTLSPFFLCGYFPRDLWSNRVGSVVGLLTFQWYILWLCICTLCSNRISYDYIVAFTLQTKPHSHIVIFRLFQRLSTTYTH